MHENTRATNENNTSITNSLKYKFLSSIFDMYVENIY